MKKILLGILLLLFLHQRYQSVNLSEYERQGIDVEIKGEVVHPGVYHSDNDMLMKELIEKAGGLTAQSDISGINMNATLEHKSVVVIPEIKEETCISINASSIEELDTLPGVGTATAQRIIDYRNANGGFKQLEDIMKIRGIKSKLFEKMRERICL